MESRVIYHHERKKSFRRIFLVICKRICYFIYLDLHLIKEWAMKQSILMLLMLAFLWGCENTKGQNRHDPNHHDKTIQTGE